VMSYLWMSAPIPIGCTALLPLPLFPMLGISPAKSVAVSYFNDTMWVFIGSFIVALAVEKSDLHRRIALRSLTIVGTRPIMVLAAFMLVTASLSMVLSNTACAIMMVPIAGAMFDAIDNITGKSDPGLRKAVFLGIAYASSTGGLTTLTGNALSHSSSALHGVVTPVPGTGPNLIMAGQLITMYPKAPPISYTQWFLYVHALFCRLYKTSHVIPRVHVCWTRRLCHATVRVGAAVFFVGASLGLEAAAAAAATDWKEKAWRRRRR
jgi:sodium-dependent dicarboxylate transporter 2/3/5